MQTLFFSVLALILPFFQAISRLEETRQFFADQPWPSIESSFFFGDVYSYYSIDQVKTLLHNYQRDFPEIVAATVKIGETSEGRDILAIQLAIRGTEGQPELPLPSDPNESLIKNITTFQNKFEDRPAILFTGMHDGNDPISMTMVLYILKKFLSGFYKNEPEYLYLLAKRQIWLVPMINQDSYFKMNKDITQIAIVKNQQEYGDCEPGKIGVNLKLNYMPYMEVDDDHHECDLSYRGPWPFSEPETEALKNLIDMVDFSVAINYFSRHNTVLLPFNYLDKDDLNSSSLYKNFEDKQIFFDLYERSGLNPTTFFGNNYGKKKEILVGEVSDYMYHHKQIYSLSVELGHENISSTIFPLNFTGNMAVFESFYPMALYSTFKLGNQFEWTLLYQLFEACLEQHLSFMNCRGLDRQVYSARLELANYGFLAAELFPIQIDVPVELEIATISVQSEYSHLYNFNDTYFTETRFAFTKENNMRSYRIQVESLPRMSKVFIGINAIYRSSLPPSQEMTMSILENFSYNQSQGITEKLQNFGGVSGFHKIVRDDVIEEENPRMLSIVLMGVYFVGMGLTFIVSIFMYGVSKFQEPTTLSPY